MRHGHLKHLHRKEEKDVQPRQLQGDTATLVSVVYVTAAKTFDGPIAGFTTISPVAPVSNTVAAVPVTTPTSQVQAVTTSVQDIPIHNTSAPSSQQAQTEATPTISSVSSNLVEPVSSSADSTQVASPTATSTSSPTVAVPTNSSSSTSTSVASPTSQTTPFTLSNSAAAVASSPISTANVAPSISNNSHGLSGGGIAGLTIGILLGIAALLALLVFCYRRKKKTTRSETEKNNPFGDEAHVASGTASVNPEPNAQFTRAVSLAPRLSLRPGSQFLPGMLGGKRTSRTTSTPANDALVNEQELAAAPVTTLSEKSPVSNEANNPKNPFGNHAEGANGSAQDVTTLPAAQAPAPLNDRLSTSEGAAIASAGLAAGSAASLVKRQNMPKPLNLQANHSASHILPLRDTATPSPVGSQFSMTSMTPSALASGMATANVHRIQLDFKPSMDDELELRAGQLVRLLHEYDDGWALCIRLDRSQQGVAPRTCLSTRPVKPRPNGNARGPAPPSMLGAGQQRSASPANPRTPIRPTPAPALAAIQRSVSPDPYGGGPQGAKESDPEAKKRSNSAAAIREQPSSPPETVPMIPNVEEAPVKQQVVTPVLEKVVPRKPVPGKSA